ncbi:TonB-dependent receptor [Salegentibacter sp. JZCK2]|uniref:TonB-dependent receptor n=1 Tax=Salegentibacter tibetensis TaxID=2873600 RepID=UPI001CCFD790|nr:TonB-dependent receptor [Salegentibacter tibetensis]MBZ9728779.1 TonB-dependent receptor [Salegentibacter tibetensis]
MKNIIEGEKKFESSRSIQNKALRINLNKNIYGTFAEIGAGQETVRNFFRAGGASGTIAKTISAYDKDFSDAIYGPEPQGRYVTEARLKDMLDFETKLIEERISREKHPKKLFFSYANTVATIDFAKKYKGHGWLGIKFQTQPETEYNQILIHVQFNENNAAQQQITLGLLGVNLIYGSYYYYDNPKKLLKSLYDHIDTDKIEIDAINFHGPSFEKVDNRLISLELLRNGITEAVMFGADGNNVLPASVLYKKNILTLRGSFRPVTRVNMNMYEESLKLFLQEKKVEEEDTIVIFEITLNNLKAEGDINEKDFLDRADLLCSLGHTVMISNFQEYYKVVEYFSQHTKKQMGLTMGVNTLTDIFNPEYYTNLSGGILEAFGKLFFKNLKIYLYPLKENGEILNSENINIPEGMKELYQYFKDNKRVVDIENYESEILDIHSRKVHEMIMEGEKGWETMLPEKTTKQIQEEQLFQTT